MSTPIKLGILGYGNLGKGTELSIKANPDMELVAIFTRRNPSELKSQTNTPVVSVDEIGNYKDKIDVLILCGGSATDLPQQTPEFAKSFNVVDSFDTHAKIPEHFSNVNKSAKDSNHVALISCGWDPGLFSLNRLMADCFLQNGNSYTFWGKGVSQGHSDAIRRIKGVKNAIQYTVPVEKSVNSVRNGENPELSTRQKHLRECYVVAEEGANKEEIEKEIKTMKNYFDEYDTVVNFISMEELKQNHSGLPHGGSVIYSGTTGDGTNKHVIEYSLQLDSNPEFTGAVLVAYARAAARMNKEGMSGAKTVLDIAPAYLSALPGDELRAHYL